MAATAVRRVDAPRKRSPHVRAATPAAAKRPELRLVPRPRVAANAIMLLVTLVAGLMLAAVVLHTRLAERQLEIDRLENSVDDAHARFDVLRQQRAELRSPNRLAIEAGALGLVPAPDTEFLTVDGYVLAHAIAAAGLASDVDVIEDQDDPLDQIRRVREAGAGR